MSSLRLLASLGFISLACCGVEDERVETSSSEITTLVAEPGTTTIAAPDEGMALLPSQVCVDGICRPGCTKHADCIEPDHKCYRMNDNANACLPVSQYACSVYAETACEETYTVSRWCTRMPISWEWNCLHPKDTDDPYCSSDANTKICAYDAQGECGLQNRTRAQYAMSWEACRRPF